MIFFTFATLNWTVWITCNNVYQLCRLQAMWKSGDKVLKNWCHEPQYNDYDSFNTESKAKYQIGILNFKRLLLLFTFLSRQCGNLCTYTLSKVEILSCHHCSQNAHKLTVVSIPTWLVGNVFEIFMIFFQCSHKINWTDVFILLSYY